MPTIHNINIDNVSEYKVEDFARLIIDNKIEKQHLISKIEALKLGADAINKILQKVEFAYDRISKSLDLDQVVLFIVFPFGMVNRLYKNDFFDAEENLRLGFVKKVNEYYRYSFLGVFTYIACAIIFYLF